MKRWFKLKWDHKGEPYSSMTGIVIRTLQHTERYQRYTDWQWEAARWWPLQTNERGPQRKSALPACWFYTFSHQNCENMIFCCLVFIGILLWNTCKLTQLANLLLLLLFKNQLLLWFSPFSISLICFLCIKFALLLWA